MEVSNKRLNLRIGVKSVAPQTGHLILFSEIKFSSFSLSQPSAVTSPLVTSSINLSARCLLLHFLQSIKGSANDAT